MQTVQDDKTLELSKDIQQYLPRPRYDRALEESLIKTLQTLHSGPVQTGVEAGLAPVQLREWNSAKDQLDWRRRYYAPEYGAPSPRDYAKVLSLDDAVVLEVTLSFGTEATDEGQLLPAVSAALRLYRAGTSRLLWSREEMLTEKTSSMTLSEFRAEPRELTRILENLAPRLGEAAARSTAKALGLTPRRASRPGVVAGGRIPGTTSRLRPLRPAQADLTPLQHSVIQRSLGTIGAPLRRTEPPPLAVPATAQEYSAARHRTRRACFRIGSNQSREKSPRPWVWRRPATAPPHELAPAHEPPPSGFADLVEWRR